MNVRAYESLFEQKEQYLRSVMGDSDVELMMSGDDTEEEKAIPVTHITGNSEEKGQVLLVFENKQELQLLVEQLQDMLNTGDTLTATLLHTKQTTFDDCCNKQE